MTYYISPTEEKVANYSINHNFIQIEVQFYGFTF